MSSKDYLPRITVKNKPRSSSRLTRYDRKNQVALPKIKITIHSDLARIKKMINDILDIEIKNTKQKFQEEQDKIRLINRQLKYAQKPEKKSYLKQKLAPSLDIIEELRNSLQIQNINKEKYLKYNSIDTLIPFIVTQQEWFLLYQLISSYPNIINGIKIENMHPLNYLINKIDIRNNNYTYLLDIINTLLIRKDNYILDYFKTNDFKLHVFNYVSSIISVYNDDTEKVENFIKKIYTPMSLYILQIDPTFLTDQTDSVIKLFINYFNIKKFFIDNNIDTSNIKDDDFINCIIFLIQIVINNKYPFNNPDIDFTPDIPDEYIEDGWAIEILTVSPNSILAKDIDRFLSDNNDTFFEILKTELCVTSQTERKTKDNFKKLYSKILKIFGNIKSKKIDVSKEHMYVYYFLKYFCKKIHSRNQTKKTTKKQTRSKRSNSVVENVIIRQINNVETTLNGKILELNKFLSNDRESNNEEIVFKNFRYKILENNIYNNTKNDQSTIQLFNNIMSQLCNNNSNNYNNHLERITAVYEKMLAHLTLLTKKIEFYSEKITNPDIKIILQQYKNGIEKINDINTKHFEVFNKKCIQK